MSLARNELKQEKKELFDDIFGDFFKKLEFCERFWKKKPIFQTFYVIFSDLLGKTDYVLFFFSWIFKFSNIYLFINIFT